MFLECSSWFYSQDNPVSFLGSGMDIRGDDLDLKARYRLIPGTTTFLQRSVELSEDLCSYQSFQVLKDRDSSAAALIFENEPPEIQTKLSSESIPFDDAYRGHTYQEALAIFEETGALQEGADETDEGMSERFVYLLWAWRSKPGSHLMIPIQNLDSLSPCLRSPARSLVCLFFHGLQQE